MKNLLEMAVLGQKTCLTVRLCAVQDGVINRACLLLKRFRFPLKKVRSISLIKEYAGRENEGTVKFMHRRGYKGCRGSCSRIIGLSLDQT